MTPNQRYIITMVSIIGGLILILCCMCSFITLATGQDARDNYKRNYPPISTTSPEGWKP